MLSLDSLIACSKERGMPEGKLRGAAREYVQVLTMKALCAQPSAGDLVFLGGTALRLGYVLPRFSEDLDFDARSLSSGQWKALLEATAHELARSGLKPELRCSERGSLLSGDIRFSGFLQAYGLSPVGTEKLAVKIEANRPGYAFESEPRVISGYGEMFPAPFAGPGLMFAEKVLALLGRELGRDVYDIFFMAGRRWRPDRRILKARGVEEPVVEAILRRISGWGPKRLAVMARRLEPFLFEPEQVKLVAQAQSLLVGALEYLVIR